MPPDTSSRHSATRAIMARAESFTDDGLCPSAQLIVASAVALLAGVFDQLQNAIVVLMPGNKRTPAACR